MSKCWGYKHIAQNIVYLHHKCAKAQYYERVCNQNVPLFPGVAMALCFCLRSAYQMDLLETHLRFRANVVKSGLDNQSSLSASPGHFQPYWQDLSDYTAIKRTMLDL